MSYSKSKALKELESAYADVLGRLRLVRGAGTDPAISEYVKAAAIFLAHAQFENFFTDLISIYAICLQNSTNSSDSLPKELRAYLFLSRGGVLRLISAYQAGGSEVDLIKDFSGVGAGAVGSYMDGRRQIMPFDGRHILSERKYPSADNLSKVFSRMGIDKVFNVLNARAGYDCKSRIESLGAFRTQLAHTASIPGVSPRDIRARLIDVRDVARIMDRVVCSSVCALAGNPVWKANAV